MKLKLNCGNLVQGVDTWTACLLRYLAAFISWKKCALHAIDRKTKKLFKIYGRLHSKSDVDRLYIPRKDGEREMIAIESCVEMAVKGLEMYDHGSEERLLQTASEDWVDGLEAESVLKKKTSKKKKRLQDLEEKALHGQYLKQTKEVRSE